MARIKIPKKFLEQEKLFRDVHAKHVAEGAASPLHRFDVAGVTAKISEARTFHNEAEEKSKQAEAAYENRNNRVTPSVKELRRWAQLLKQVYKNNPHELGNWGFEVDDSPRAAKPKPDEPSQ